MLGNFFLSNRRKTAPVTLIPKNQGKLNYIPNVIKVKRMSLPDMNNIHDFALKHFSNQVKQLPEYKQRLINEKKMLGPHQNYVERCQTNSNIANITETISIIESGVKREKYLIEVLPLMDKYKEIYNKIGKSTFGEEEEEKEEEEELTKCMLLYVDVVKKYTGISFDVELTSKYRCIECEFDLTDVIPDIDGTIRCPECRVENEFNRCPKKTTSLNKGINSSHGDYSERLNFYKFIIRFQGKYEPSIDENLMDKLDKYFIKEKRPTGDIIRKNPYDHKGFKEGTSLSLMLKALSFCGFSENYDDVYLICSRYWGWELVDFRDDEEIIMYIYDMTQIAYIKIENKTRSSSISIPFRAFKIIELLQYPYDVTDFKIPKDDKSREDTEKYWKICCETCGDPNIVYIPTRKF